MARIIYENMAREDITDESVYRELHDAIRELRDRWLDTLTNIKQKSKAIKK